jgi:hypothetical protein
MEFKGKIIAVVEPKSGDNRKRRMENATVCC